MLGSHEYTYKISFVLQLFYLIFSIKKELE